jgi:hypothetical protein
MEGTANAQRSEKEVAKQASIKHFDERSKDFDVNPVLLQVCGAASKVSSFSGNVLPHER